jgi:hypothetical protein
MQKCTKLENNKATKYREQKKQNLKKLVFNKTKPDFNKKSQKWRVVTLPQTSLGGYYPRPRGGKP